MNFPVSHHKGEQVHMERTLHHVKEMLVSLLAVLLLMHIVAFFIFSFVESNEVRHAMMLFEQSLTQTGQDQDDALLAQGGIRYDDGYAIIPAINVPVGFYDVRMNGVPYVAYHGTGVSFSVAQRKEVLDAEARRFAYALAVLFAGEIFVMGMWWFVVRRSVHDLFIVH